MPAIDGTLHGSGAQWVLHAAGDLWTIQAHPEILLPLFGLAGGYIWAMAKLGPRYAPDPDHPATPQQFTLFLVGIVSLLVVLVGPVHAIAEDYWYSMHMAQHLVVTLIAPPLLLLGTPAWLAQLILRPAPVLGVARWVSRAIPALLIFNGIVLLTHLPSVVELIMTREIAHSAAHGALFWGAVVMWMPMCSPHPEIPRISYPSQMMYLFAQSILPTVPASFLTFSTEPLYAFYEQAPRLAGLDAITDQRIGGLIMKLLGGFYLWGIITVVFFRWYARDEAENTHVLNWPTVERELEDMGLTKR